MTEQWAVPAATRLVVHLDIAVVRPILRIVLSCVGCYSTHYREGGMSGEPGSPSVHGDGMLERI